MTPDIQRLKQLLGEALALPLAERAAFVARSCGADAALREELERLIQADENAGDFLGHSAVPPESDICLETTGSFIGRYKLLQEIGEGGFGRVFMAEQTEPVRRRVALKIVKAGMDTKEVIARFEAERQALALMDHPNIARVLDAGSTETGRPYFVMELVNGIPITDYCDQQQLATTERLQLFINVCAAVQHAHQKGIIHRDLKPTNILITLIDGQPVPKVIDFGVAKALGQKLTEKTLFTAFQQMIGTPAYMSPEQAALSGVDVDTRSDIYALGVLLYELLTGETPFDADTLHKAALDEIRRMIREIEPPKPSTRLSALGEKLTEVAQRHHTEPGTLTRQVRGDLDWIVMKALEKDRARRYETPNSLVEDLHRHLNHEPVRAGAPSADYRARKFIRRHRFGVAMAITLALALGIGLTATLLGFGQARRERDRAERLAWDEAAQRQRAEAGEKKAQGEAEKSRQVARFLQDMLGGVGASLARGRDTTMLREIMEKTEDHLGKDLKAQPEVRAELQYTLAGVYHELSQNVKAEALYRESLATRRKVLGNESVEVGNTLYGLAAVVAQRWKPGEAAPLCREALAIQRKVLGNEHPDVARTLNLMADLLTYDAEVDGGFDEPEALFREALAMNRKLLGNDHPQVAISLRGLSFLLVYQRKPAEAEKVGREGLELSRKLYITEHPELVDSLWKLAEVLQRNGKLAEAEALYRECLAMIRRLWDGKESRLCGILRRLGVTLRDQGKLVETEAAFREVVDNEAWWCRAHTAQEVAFCRHQLRMLLRRQGRFSEVASLYRQAAELGDPGAQFGLADMYDLGDCVARDSAQAAEWYRKAAESENDFPSLSSTKLMAQYRFGRKCELGDGVAKDETEAARQYRKVIESGNAVALTEIAWRLLFLGNADSRDGRNALRFAETAVALSGRKNPKNLSLYASACADAGQFTNAIAIQKEAIALVKNEKEKQNYASQLRLYESGIPCRDFGAQAGQILAWLAHGKFAEAEPLARECLAYGQLLFPDDWRTFNAQSQLGGCLLGEKKYAESDPFLVSGYRGMKQREDKIPAPERPRLKEALQRLIQLYEATDRTDQAAEWKQRLAEFEETAATKQPAAQPPPK